MNRHAIVPLVLLTLAGGCAGRVNEAAPVVPPLRAETVPRPTVAETVQIWQPGDWQWTGNGYVWTPGRYVPRGTHSNMWLPGHWEGVSGNFTWVPGRWL